MSATSSTSSSSTRECPISLEEIIGFGAQGAWKKDDGTINFCEHQEHSIEAFLHHFAVRLIENRNRTGVDCTLCRKQINVIGFHKEAVNNYLKEKPKLNSGESSSTTTQLRHSDNNRYEILNDQERIIVEGFFVKYVEKFSTIYCMIQQDIMQEDSYFRGRKEEKREQLILKEIEKKQAELVLLTLDEMKEILKKTARHPTSVVLPNSSGSSTPPGYFSKENVLKALLALFLTALAAFYIYLKVTSRPSYIPRGIGPVPSPFSRV